MQFFHGRWNSWNYFIRAHGWRHYIHQAYAHFPKVVEIDSGTSFINLGPSTKSTCVPKCLFLKYELERIVATKEKQYKEVSILKIHLEEEKTKEEYFTNKLQEKDKEINRLNKEGLISLNIKTRTLELADSREWRNSDKLKGTRKNNWWKPKEGYLQFKIYLWSYGQGY